MRVKSNPIFFQWQKFYKLVIKGLSNKIIVLQNRIKTCILTVNYVRISKYLVILFSIYKIILPISKNLAYYEKEKNNLLFGRRP